MIMLALSLMAVSFRPMFKAQAIPAFFRLVPWRTIVTFFKVQFYGRAWLRWSFLVILAVIMNAIGGGAAFAETEGALSEKEIKEHFEKQRKAWEQVEAANTELQKEVKALGTASAEAKTKVEKSLTDFGKTVDEAKKAIDEATKRIDAMQVEMQKRSNGRLQRKSAGQVFVESEAGKKLLTLGGGRDAKTYHTDAVQVKNFWHKADEPLQEGDLTDGGSVYGGALVAPQRIPGIITEPEQQLRIRDLLNATPAGSALIEFVRETEFAKSDASLPGKGGAGTVEELAAKPQSRFKFELAQAAAQVIATWVPASRQILSDANMLRNHIDTRLRYSLKLEEENQLLFGDGTPPNLEGITTIAEAYDRYTTDDTMIDTLRRAITQVFLSFYPVTGFVLNPEDWEEVELTKDENLRYIIGDPNTLLGPRIWGVPVVGTPSVDQGNFLAGAFGLGSQLFDVEGVSIRVGEPGDYFLKNTVAILAEERLLLVNYRPKAFVYGPFENPAS